MRHIHHRRRTHLDNGWNEWSRHVLAELDRLNGCYEKMNDKLDRIDKRLTVIEVKAGFFGGIAGLITGLVVAYIKTKI